MIFAYFGGIGKFVSRTAGHPGFYEVKVYVRKIMNVDSDIDFPHFFYIFHISTFSTFPHSENVEKYSVLEI